MGTFEPAPSEAALRDLCQPSPLPADEGEQAGHAITTAAGVAARGVQK